MRMETGLPETDLVWNHWCADAVGTHHIPRRMGHYQPRVKVLPGNPSLPLRVMLASLSRRMNGGMDGTALGIDLAIRGNEVRKLFYAGRFTGTLLREGIDPEEFLQEVYRGILARNLGACPWDVKKSSFGHYVHIVIRCVLSNYLRRERLRGTRETVTSDGEVPTQNILMSQDGLALGDLLDGLYGEGDDRDRVQQFLSALYAGQTRKEALDQVGMEESWGVKVLSEIRQSLVEEA